MWGYCCFHVLIEMENSSGFSDLPRRGYFMYVLCHVLPLLCRAYSLEG